MGLRETLNKNQTAVMIGSAAVVVLAIGAAIFLGSGGRPAAGQGGPAKAYFTTDNGASYFVADDLPINVPPCQIDGKTAYRCEVWTCDDGKTKQVIYLQKWSDRAKKRVDDARTQDKLDDPVVVQIMETGLDSMVKLPTAPDTAEQWAPITSTKAIAIMKPNCPAGVQPTRVDPNNP